MAKKTKREKIPSDIAARVLFFSNRTCCVCRSPGKPVQIHHIDDNPSNNDESNLAVLCFDCHRETQIKGGFDRKIDADQIILYRDDWKRIVASSRATSESQKIKTSTDKKAHIELITSIAETYRENREYELLAMHYHAIDNIELRDKYIEIALQNNSSDQSICFLRSLQNKPELIPNDVILREEKRYSKHKDWLQRGRFYKNLHRYLDSTKDYIRGIKESLDNGRIFSAAYYLKELFEEGLTTQLFILALAKSKEENDLWWQVRALQELDWKEELDKLLVSKEKEIIKSNDLMLQELLYYTKGNVSKAINIKKQIAKGTRTAVFKSSRKKSSSKKKKYEYRRKKGSDTWHTCRTCQWWPTKDYEVSYARPSNGEFCNICRHISTNR